MASIVAQLSFQAFACEALGDVSLRYLPPDYALECGPEGAPTAEYRRLQTVAAVAIACYPIGISLATALLLYLAREPLRAGRATEFTRAIGFLHDGYAPRFFWWELVEQLRKLLLVGLAALARVARRRRGDARRRGRVPPGASVLYYYRAIIYYVQHIYRGRLLPTQEVSMMSVMSQTSRGGGLRCFSRRMAKI